ncbi:MAG: hypothetical protein KF878_10240 [Planctomycetes bacterium]|nr:hypothetical protein [Planctomycetota bacterium]
MGLEPTTSSLRTEPEHYEDPRPARACAEPAREADRASVRPGAARRDLIIGKLDPIVSTIARWADESPDAMRRLLTDDALRAQVVAALSDVVGPSLDVRADRSAAEA